MAEQRVAKKAVMMVGLTVVSMVESKAVNLAALTAVYLVVSTAD